MPLVPADRVVPLDRDHPTVFLEGRV